jgi:hypothetical protein
MHSKNDIVFNATGTVSHSVMILHTPTYICQRALTTPIASNAIKRRIRVFTIAARFIGAQSLLIGARPEVNERNNLLDDFYILGLLGTGGFAKVYRVEHKVTGRMFALKVVAKAELSERAKKNMPVELEALRRLAGIPGFLQLGASFHDSENYYLLTVSRVVTRCKSFADGKV